MAGASWLDQLEAQIDGARGAPPLEQFTGLAPRRAGLGESGYTLPASPWFCAPPPGRLQGGVTITLVEAAIFAALRTPLRTDHPFHPVELKVNLLRPLASDGRLAAPTGSSCIRDAGWPSAGARSAMPAAGPSPWPPGRPCSVRPWSASTEACGNAGRSPSSSYPHDARRPGAGRLWGVQPAVRARAADVLTGDPRRGRIAHPRGRDRDGERGVRRASSAPTPPRTSTHWLSGMHWPARCSPSPTRPCPTI